MDKKKLSIRPNYKLKKNQSSDASKYNSRNMWVIYRIELLGNEKKKLKKMLQILTKCFPSPNRACNVRITASSVSGPGRCIRSSISLGNALLVFTILLGDNTLGLISGMSILLISVRRGSVPVPFVKSKWEREQKLENKKARTKKRWWRQECVVGENEKQESFVEPVGLHRTPLKYCCFFREWKMTKTKTLIIAFDMMKS